jgi:hypothetical protein
VSANRVNSVFPRSSKVKVNVSQNFFVHAYAVVGKDNLALGLCDLVDADADV